MKFLIITGNPKNDGLCKSITDQVEKGALDGGAQAEVLSVAKLDRCRVCGAGWGICKTEGRCVFGDKDGFNEAQKKVKEADLICLITPVYCWEMSDSLKSFIDKLRRCEYFHKGLAGKQMLLVASPGGTGNGMLTCLEQMERFCKHTGADIFDFIGINRWNNDYKGVAAYSAAKAMAEGRKSGETL